MFICSKCKKEVNFEQMVKDKKAKSGLRSYCYLCKYKEDKPRITADKKEKLKIYFKRYYTKDRLYGKVKTYRSDDKKKGYASITLEEARLIVKDAACYYCTSGEDIGLDRLDNNDGHHVKNVVACCEKCNILLTDLPIRAKELLKPALETIQKEGVLSQWRIPTKRKNK